MLIRICSILLIIFLACGAVGVAGYAAAQPQAEPMLVDYRYAPAWWQTLISMTDDPQKTIISKEGDLLYDYAVNGRYRGFDTKISTSLDGNVQWVKQEVVTPRVPVVRTVLRTESVEMVEDAFAVGPPMTGTPRCDILIIRLHNDSKSAVTVAPSVTVESKSDVSVDDSTRRSVSVADKLRITATEQYKTSEKIRRGVTLRFSDVALQPGTYYLIAISVAFGAQTETDQFDMVRAEVLRGQVEKFWQGVGLPFTRIRIPDQQIQALLDSSIRNIYQSREIKNGLPTFEAGPTVYRGQSMIDSAFIIDSAACLGLTDDARSGIQYLLNSWGEAMPADGVWKRPGVLLWTVTRHAKLTGDKKWLLGVWPKVENSIKTIQMMREMASSDPNSPAAGLIPPGLSNCGLDGQYAEYTNIYWTMIGMRSAIEAARWLGKDTQADEWKTQYNDFYAKFLFATERDMQQDANSNRYLPVRMENKGKAAPQKSQYAFLQAIFPGKVFDGNPLVFGNLSMLECCESEGTACGTGWMSDGVCNYFTGLYGNAWLWQGRGDKSAQLIYSLANHASPTLCWREEQKLHGNGDDIYGDMPHNWTGAEFIRLVRNSLVLERGKELHLFEGMPARWVKPDSEIAVMRIPSEFGPISLSLLISADGTCALLKVTPPSRVKPQKIIVHLNGWSGKTGTLEISTTARTTKKISIVRRTAK